MPRMQVYLPDELYREVKTRGLPASELLQVAVRAAVKRRQLLEETDRYLAETTEGARLSGTVHGDAGGAKGELNWRGADGVRLHVQAFAAYGQNAPSAWVQGVADDGSRVVVHLAPDDVALWQNGVRRPGSGALAQGTVKVH